ALTVFVRNESSHLIVCDIEESLAREESWIKNIETYVEFQESPITPLVRLLKSNNLEKSRIAIEVDFLSYRYARELKEKLPSIKVSPAEPIFNKLKVIK